VMNEKVPASAGGNNVVFLDLDGTLTSTASLAQIEPERVERVNRLVAETGAVIVITSERRLTEPLHAIVGELVRAGLRGEVIGATEVYSPGGVVIAAPRHVMIRRWLSAHTVSSFVVLDDDREADVDGRLVLVDDGLEDEHVEIALEVLRR
jgi:hypothetical protein